MSQHGNRVYGPPGFGVSQSRPHVIFYLIFLKPPHDIIIHGAQQCNVSCGFLLFPSLISFMIPSMLGHVTLLRFNHGHIQNLKSFLLFKYILDFYNPNLVIVLVQFFTLIVFSYNVLSNSSHYCYYRKKFYAQLLIPYTYMNFKLIIKC